MRSAGSGKDRGVNTDKLAGQIDQRAAGIAGIDRGVGLDEELIVGNADLSASERRDDAVRHRLADAERVADGEHDVADLQLVRISKIDRGETLFRLLDLQHREICPAVLQHDLGFVFALVCERYLHLGRAFDHVIVGDDEPG